MVPGVHLMVSWLGSVQFMKDRRERALVTLAGIAPDIDGAGYVVDELTGTTNYFYQYHHYLGHSLVAGVGLTLLTALLARTQRVRATVCTFAVFHLHLLCDLVGSRGPDGYQWPIYYLYPFNSTYELVWSGQWALDAWPNVATWCACVVGCFYYVHTRQITFFEILGDLFNRTAVKLYNGMVRRTAK